jgi:2-keto-4-pentenoate hydratase/2-oxohepta-3-ene-1,7-dioic acid hydratase in catechol pathway
MAPAACGCLSHPGKAMDAYAPIGPAIVTTDEIGDPHTLGIRCFLNGATVQVCAR